MIETKCWPVDRGAPRKPAPMRQIMNVRSKVEADLQEAMMLSQENVALLSHVVQHQQQTIAALNRQLQLEKSRSKN